MFFENVLKLSLQEGFHRRSCPAMLFQLCANQSGVHKVSIVKARIAHLFQNWVNMCKKSSNLSIKETVQGVFSHFEANRELCSLLNERGLIYLLKDVTLDLCGFNPEQDVAAAYSSAYVGSFLYGWIEVWFRRGMRDTAEELIAYLSQ